MNAMVAKHTAEKRDEFLRLQSYLVPKLTTLDLTALAAASARGEADLAHIPVAVDACSKQCGGPLALPTTSAKFESMNTCLETCTNDDTGSKRVRSCFPVNWLPF